MKRYKTNNIIKLSGMALLVALMVSMLLVSLTASAEPYRHSTGNPAQAQQISQYTRMEEVRAIYKGKETDEYLVFLANTPSVIIVNKDTKFESLIGTVVSFNSFDQLTKGRIVRVEAVRDSEGRLLAEKVTILDRSAENLRILDESRKVILFGQKDFIRSQEKGVRNNGR